MPCAGPCRWRFPTSRSRGSSWPSWCWTGTRSEPGEARPEGPHHQPCPRCSWTRGKVTYCWNHWEGRQGGRRAASGPRGEGRWQAAHEQHVGPGGRVQAPWKPGRRRPRLGGRLCEVGAARPGQLLRGALPLSCCRAARRGSPRRAGRQTPSALQLLGSCRSAEATRLRPDETTHRQALPCPAVWLACPVLGRSRAVSTWRT